MNKEYIVYGVIGTLGAAAGFGGGWLIAKKHFAKIADEEIASVRETYEKLKRRKPTLKEATENFEEAVNKDVVEKAQEISEAAGYAQAVSDRAVEIDRHNFEEARREVLRGTSFDPDDDPDTDDPVVEEEINAFQRYAGSTDEAVAIVRQPDSPYLISVESFSEPEFSHHAHLTLNYYKLDDPKHEGILADETNQIIDDVDRTVGLDNLNHFGRLSDDPNIVYVRNESVGIDYEVVLVKDRYEVVVLGVTD